MKLDMVVVGAGLFGQITAAHARSQGATVAVVSDRREGAGSLAAGCVMRPSWMSKMSRDQIDAAFTLLSGLYELKRIEFAIHPTRKTVECYRVEPNEILRPRCIEDTCRSVTDAGVVTLESGRVLEARSVVVAAGIWTTELCPWVPALSGRWGWAHRGAAVKRSIIKVWAPFRQIVAFNMDDGESWIGDGSAYVHASVNDKNEAKARERCAAVTRLRSTVLGARPYCDTGGEPCHVSRRGLTWAVTGGAKNGTASAAWAAQKVVEDIL